MHRIIWTRGGRSESYLAPSGLFCFPSFVAESLGAYAVALVPRRALLLGAGGPVPLAAGVPWRHDGDELVWEPASAPRLVRHTGETTQGDGKPSDDLPRVLTTWDGARYPITSEPFVIGRHGACHLRLRDAQVSQFHCVLVAEEGACDGTNAVALPHARDHKRAGEEDTGPNTGGMGAISPNPDVTPAIEAQVRTTIIEPVLGELARRGTPFVGFLYAGLMLTAEGPKLLEFNVRHGDPEAQAVLPQLAPGAFLGLCNAIVRGELGSFSLIVQPAHTCAVVLATAGYPDKPRLGDSIYLGDGAESAFHWLDFAGVTARDGRLTTSGGRVMAVVGRGTTAVAARSAAYAGVQKVTFTGMHFRRDIGRDRS